MSSADNSNNTKLWGWSLAAAAIAFIILFFIASYGFGASLLLAVLIGVLVAILLWIMSSRDAEPGLDTAPAARPEVGNVASGTMATGATGIAAPPNVTEAPAGDPVVKDMPAEKPRDTAPPKPAAKPKAAAKTSAKSASTSTSADAAPKPSAVKSPPKATKAAAKPAAEAAGKAQKAAKPAAAPKSAATSKPGKSATAPATADTPKAAKPGSKPAMLSAARDGGPDDLKMIKGVGPKLEGELHRMGVYHFDQVAAWTKKEVDWMDENLEGVRGRVSRDGWVKQAGILAKGGSTEFSTRAKKGGVY